MKRIISIVLTLVLLLSAVSMVSLPVSAATSGTTGECTWSLDGTVLTISGNGAMGIYSYSSSSPWGKSITNVIIKKGVTTIGNNAFFDCSSLKKVTIPDSVISIGDAAFRGCTSLKSVTIPDSVTTIDKNAFYYCESMISVTIPDSVTSIGAGAFYACTSLKAVTIPATSIGEYAFSGCALLTSVTIADSVTSIGPEAFCDCTSLKEVHITDIAAWCSIDFAGYAANPLKKGAVLYLNGEKVTDLVIPEGVTSIGGYAFYEYNSLTSIVIPGSVTSIGEYAFRSCKSLKSVTVSTGTTSIDPALNSCKLLTSVTIPDAINAIGEYAFAYCESIKSVTIPDGITSIDSFAFKQCISLTSVVIPNSVTSIGEHAFSDCVSLPSVTIPEGTISVESSSFSYCRNVCTVVLSKTAALPTNWMEPFSRLQCIYFSGNKQEWKDMSYLLPNENVTVHAEATAEDMNVINLDCSDRIYCELCKKDVHVTIKHRGDKWVITKKATVNQEGFKVLSCIKCGIVLDTQVIRKTGEYVLKIFKDLKKSDWYVKNGAIDFAYNQGLFSGTSATTFGAKNDMTRGMFVTVLGRLHGVKSTKATTKFTDVKKNAYYSGYVAWASENGIVSGITATTFRPENSINREQICAIMVRYCKFAGIELKNINKAVSFVDAKSISPFARKAVTACQVGGIVGGEKVAGGYRFRPKGNATRAEVATIMMKFYNNYIK